MTAAEPRALMMAMFDVEQGHEEEFNRWYEEEHFPERMLCPGFISGRRFTAVTGGTGIVTDSGFREVEPTQKYLTIYDLESLDALQTEAYRAVSRPSAWTNRIYRHWQRPVRSVYVEMPRPQGFVFTGRKP